MVYGLSAALQGAITFADLQRVEQNFPDYVALRRRRKTGQNQVKAGPLCPAVFIAVPSGCENKNHDLPER